MISCQIALEWLSCNEKKGLSAILSMIIRNTFFLYELAGILCTSEKKRGSCTNTRTGIYMGLQLIMTTTDYDYNDTVLQITTRIILYIVTNFKNKNKSVCTSCILFSWFIRNGPQ